MHAACQYTEFRGHRELVSARSPYLPQVAFPLGAESCCESFSWVAGLPASILLAGPLSALSDQQPSRTAIARTASSSSSVREPSFQFEDIVILIQLRLGNCQCPLSVSSAVSTLISATSATASSRVGCWLTLLKKSSIKVNITPRK